MTRSNFGRQILIVGECKNIDLVFYKDGGIAQALSVAKKASSQIRRKAAWVSDNWRSLADSLNWPAPQPQISGIIVARGVALPTLYDKVPVLHPYELPEFVNMLGNMLQPFWPILAH
jgi:hypothetical protein